MRFHSYHSLQLLYWEEEKQRINSQYQRDIDLDMIQPAKKRLRIAQDNDREPSNSQRDMVSPTKPELSVSPLIEEPPLSDTPSNDGDTMLRSSCSVDDGCDPNVAEDVPDSDNNDESLSPLQPLTPPTTPPPIPDRQNQCQKSDEAFPDQNEQEVKESPDMRGRDQPYKASSAWDFLDYPNIDEFFSTRILDEHISKLELLENGIEESLIDPLATSKHDDDAKDQSNDEEQGPNIIDADSSLALGTHQTTSDRAADPSPNVDEDVPASNTGDEKLSPLPLSPAS